MTKNNVYNGVPQEGNDCTTCPADYFCPGGTADKQPLTGNDTSTTVCGTDYIGSLYHKVARYAMQACIRPSTSKAETMPQSVLQDINIVMDKIRVDMAKSLSAECERLGGIWVNYVWTDNKTDCYALDNENAPDKFITSCNRPENDTAAKITTCIRDKCKEDKTTETTPDGLHDTTGQSQFKKFYNETSANTKWGFCATDTSKPIETTTAKQETNESYENESNESESTQPTLNCTENETYTITISHTLGHGTEEGDYCCPNGVTVDGIKTETQQMDIVCGDKPTWPEAISKPVCSTNPECKMRFVAYWTQTGWRYLFDDDDGSSKQKFTGPDPDDPEVLSVWSVGP